MLIRLLDFSASLTRFFVWSHHLLADAFDLGKFDGGAFRVIFAGAGQTVNEFRRSAGRVVVQRHRRRSLVSKLRSRRQPRVPAKRSRSLFFSSSSCPAQLKYQAAAMVDVRRLSTTAADGNGTASSRSVSVRRARARVYSVILSFRAMRFCHYNTVVFRTTATPIISLVTVVCARAVPPIPRYRPAVPSSDNKYDTCPVSVRACTNVSQERARVCVCLYVYENARALFGATGE